MVLEFYIRSCTNSVSMFFKHPLSPHISSSGFHITSILTNKPPIHEMPTHKWLVQPLHCLTTTLSPYMYLDLTRHNVGLVYEIYDILHLFVRFSRTVTPRVDACRVTRETTKTIATSTWARICNEPSTFEGPGLDATKREGISTLDVSELWLRIHTNETIHPTRGTKRRNQGTRPGWWRWLIESVIVELPANHGSLLVEAFERILYYINPPSNYTAQVAVSTEVAFPELYSSLRQLPLDGIQHEECLSDLLLLYIKFVFTALDVYRFYRPSNTDPGPCACRLQSHIELFSLCTFDLETLFLPTYYNTILASINFSGCMEFLLKTIIPSFCSGDMDDLEMLGWKLYTWLVHAAMQSGLSGVERCLPTLPGYLNHHPFSRSLRLNFSHPAAASWLEVWRSETRWLRDSNQQRRYGGDFVDVMMIPCGPLIDITHYALRVPDRALVKSCSEEYSGEICVICLGALDEAVSIELDMCRHKMHEKCISIWANTRTVSPVRCPTCRAEVCEARPTRQGCEYCE